MSRTDTARHALPVLPRLVAWLIRQDAAWRERRKLAEMPQYRLTDMGLDRRAADAAFHRGPANHHRSRDGRIVMEAPRLG